MSQADETRLVRLCSTRDAAHQAIKEGYDQAKTLIALGQRVKITVEEAEDEITILQRAFLHKAVFPQISEQVLLPDGGGRLDWRVWKEIFRARFLGERYVLRKTPRWSKAHQCIVYPKRKTPHPVRVSTEDLGIKAYSRYIDTVIDNAVVDYGVVFRFIVSEREAVRYMAPARKPKAVEREAVAA